MPATMAAKTTEVLAQSEVRGVRDPRRNDSMFVSRGATAGAGRAPPRVRGTGAGSNVRSARGYGCENTNPNVGTGANGKRSPRLGSCSGSNANTRSFGYAARGGVLGDITNTTNIAAGRGLQTDKAKSCIAKPQPSLQPAAAVAALEPAAPALPPPAASPAVEVVEEKSTADRALDTEMIDAQSVQEYVPDINRQLFHGETAFPPGADYMDMQTDISPKMRTILVDWLVEVHMKYRLFPETLHLTINLIDRFLTRTPVMRKRLQLVGVTAMFIASKFEEINPPQLHDFAYITDNAYSKEDILIMECSMLTTLSFQIMVPTAAHFFDMLAKANACEAIHRDTAQYLLELGLLEIRMLQYTPSHVVAAALLLSNKLFKRSPLWPAAMAEEARGDEESLSSCVEVLRQLLEADRAGAGGQLQAVHKKWSMPQRNGVAKMKF